MRSETERIDRHIAFWEKRPVDRPLMGFQIGDYLFAKRFLAAKPILKNGLEVKPEMLRVEDYMPDYERMYQYSEDIDQDSFYTPSPFTAVPWMEAILGCRITAAEASMISHPCMDSLDDIESIDLSDDNPWLSKYLEFTESLVKLSDGRFPVGQPIMRGPADMMGALRGQSELVLDTFDYPEKVQKFGQRVTEAFLSVIKRQQALIPEFRGGYSMGFYHLWSPGRCIWTQEDLAALLSPSIYRECIRPWDRLIVENYDYTLFHLHPASFFILDDLLEIDGLGIVEVNKDIGGPSIPEMMGQFRKILAKKRLVIWGSLDEADLDILLDGLPYEGLYLHIVAETVDEAKRLMDYVVSRCRDSA